MQLPGKKVRGTTSSQHKVKLWDQFCRILHGPNVYILAQKEVRQNEVDWMQPLDVEPLRKPLTEKDNKVSMEQRCSFLCMFFFNLLYFIFYFIPCSSQALVLAILTDRMSSNWTFGLSWYGRFYFLIFCALLSWSPVWSGTRKEKADYWTVWMLET